VITRARVRARCGMISTMISQRGQIEEGLEPFLRGRGTAPRVYVVREQFLEKRHLLEQAKLDLDGNDQIMYSKRALPGMLAGMLARMR